MLGEKPAKKRLYSVGLNTRKCQITIVTESRSAAVWGGNGEKLNYQGAQRNFGLGKLKILNMVSQVNTFYQNLNCTPKYVQFVNYTSTVEYLRVLKSLVPFKTNPFLISLDFLLKLH